MFRRIKLVLESGKTAGEEIGTYVVSAVRRWLLRAGRDLHGRRQGAQAPLTGHTHQKKEIAIDAKFWQNQAYYPIGS